MDAHTVVTKGDKNYPSMLLDLEKPPQKLFVKGSVDVLSRPSLSIIGARKATPYGLAIARMAGRIAAESGIVVCSGGAMGCDAAAARAALDAGGTTVVISGCGADLVYPSSSADVYERCVAGGGAIVSLGGWKTPPQRFAFVQRNAIIAALSKATLITEAGISSGTMSTALIADELGRALYSVPGSIFSPQSAGTNSLIAQGAHIICTEQDLEVLLCSDYGVLRLIGGKPAQDPGRIMSALRASPMRLEDLATALQEPSSKVLQDLMDLELSDYVVLMRDGKYAPSQKFLLQLQ